MCRLRQVVEFVGTMPARREIVSAALASYLLLLLPVASQACGLGCQLVCCGSLVERRNGMEGDAVSDGIAAAPGTESPVAVRPMGTCCAAPESARGYAPGDPPMQAKTRALLRPAQGSPDASNGFKQTWSEAADPCSLASPQRALCLLHSLLLI